MNETADIWIFHAETEREFGDMLACKINDDIPNKRIKTTTDLGEPIPYVPNIKSTNIALLVYSGRKSQGWFVAHEAETLQKTKNILILLRGHDIELPAYLSNYDYYDFKDDTMFNHMYRQLIHEIKLMLTD